MTEIEVGKTYIAKNQGKSITPRSLKVKVVWVDGEHVHYRCEDEIGVKQTPMERFLEIIS